MGRGEGWQVMHDTWHDAYRRDRRGLVVRTQPQMRMTGPSTAVVYGKGPPDYCGMALGRPVLFDAKDTAKDRLYASQIPQHQASYLEACAVQGGWAFLSVRVAGRQLVVPWVSVSDAYWGKVKALPLGGAVEFGGGGWIEAVEEACSGPGRRRV